MILAKERGIPINHIDYSIENKEEYKSTTNNSAQNTNDSKSNLMFTIGIIMRIQININNETAELCSVYEGQTADEVAERLAKKHNLSEDVKERIKESIQLRLKETK